MSIAGQKRYHASLKQDDIKIVPQFRTSHMLQPVSQQKSIKVPDGSKKIGNYILGKSIGSGTFGKVHLGMHLLTCQKVAVKIIEKQKILGKDIQRVKNEIQILRTTRHRNLVHLYEIIQTQKSLLLITQYMPNGQLFNHIVKNKKLTQQQACLIFHQILDGVQYLHKMGIAHRDLKPQNVMIDYDHQVKIIDFGLSRTYSKAQRLRSACGSPCYVAPEMIDGKADYDPKRTDVWSIGVILYAMVCGTLPFIDNDIPKLYRKIMSGGYRVLKNVSPEFTDLIQKILVVNPTKRITLNQLKHHPWSKLIPHQSRYGVFKNQKITFDQVFVQKIMNFGYDKQKIIQSLDSNEKNKQTGAYYILMKKYVKSGQIIDKYIGNQKFNPIFIEDNCPMEQQDVSQTAVSTPDIGTFIKPQQQPLSTCTSNTQPHEQWVTIGTKQFQKTHNTRRVGLKSRSLLSSLLIQSLKNSRQLHKEQLKKKLEQQQLRKKAIQMYCNNESLSKATTNLFSRLPTSAYLPKYKCMTGNKTQRNSANKIYQRILNLNLSVLVKPKFQLPSLRKTIQQEAPVIMLNKKNKLSGFSTRKYHNSLQL